MTAIGHLRELVAYRELVGNLARRDLSLKYKGSTLGIVWSLLNPLLMMAIYATIFGIVLRTVNTPHYWALLLSGLLPWTFFSSGMLASTISFVRTSSLITKVYFPIESLPIANVLAHFVNFIISLVIFIPVLLIAGIQLGTSLLLLPLLLLATLAFTLGLGLLVATLTVYFRDLEHLIGIGLTAWFFVTPVLYPLNASALPPGAARYIPILKLNPLAWYTESFHSILYYGQAPSTLLFSAVLLSSVVMLVGGYLVFLHFRDRLPEEL